MASTRRRWAFNALWLIGVLLPLALVVRRYHHDDDHDKDRLVSLRRLPKANQTMRELEWGQVQFLHTTDIHGHLAAHHSPLPPSTSFSADWADWTAFVEHMRLKARNEGHDLIVADTGDLVTGHGLSDATSPKGSVSNNLVAMTEYDVLTVGNHELLDDQGFSELRDNFIPKCRGRYITSNVDVLDAAAGDWTSLGERWTTFVLPQTGKRVTVLGFVFDFDSPIANVSITRPDLVLKEEWFTALPLAQTDIWLLAGHMPLDGDAEDHWDSVLSALREQIGHDTPIVALGGHTHVRACRRYDAASILLQSGRFHETAGWVSLQWDGSDSPATPSFFRRYIDLNPRNLAHHLGQPLTRALFTTPTARAIRRRLRDALSRWELDVVHGHAPRDFYLERHAANDTRSILNATTAVLRQTLIAGGGGSRLAILNSGSLRSDLRAGPFTTGDQFIVSPFSDSFWVVPKVPWRMARLLVDGLNGAAAAAAVAEVSAQGVYEGAGVQHDVGYATLDHCGPGGALSDDGDDTVHSPMPVVPFEPAYLSASTIGGEGKDVDVITVRYLLPRVLDTLSALDPTWQATEKSYLYLDDEGRELKTRDLWKRHAERFWNGDEGQRDGQWWKAQWKELQRQAGREGHDVYIVE